MIIGIPNEQAQNETRVAIYPELAANLIDDGFDVVLESGAGTTAGWSNDAFSDAGCDILESREAVYDAAEIVFQVTGVDEGGESYRAGQTVIGMLDPHNLDEELETLAEQDITAFALELIPRISRAQSMDALSSMSSIGGYKAALIAAESLPKLFPMQMTAAGTVRPADVFVVGAGVAGLQAIATGERLGASVRAYDIRPEVKEEVESLGGEFVELELEAEDASDEEGHAREQDEAFYEKQREMMFRVVADSDVLITTAAIPGRPSPELVTTEMIEGMDPGSVIVDLAAAGGGNCEPTEPNETVVHEGVTIYGPTNLPSTVAHTASRLYANNLSNFLENMVEDGQLVIDTDDEIVDATMLTHDGTIRYPPEDDGGDDD